MKKISNLILFLITMYISMFFSMNITYAVDCSTHQYACITCTYEDNSQTYKYNVYCDDKGIANIDKDYKKIDSTSRSVYQVSSDTISAAHFKNGNKLTCRDSIYVKYSAGGRNNNISFSVTTDSTTARQDRYGTLNIKNSTDNGKSCGNENSANAIKSCSYVINLQYGNTKSSVPDGLTLTSDGEKIYKEEYSSSNYTSANDASKLSEIAKMFKSGNNLVCPNLYVECNGNARDGKYYCRISKDNEARPGQGAAGGGTEVINDDVDVNTNVENLTCESLFGAPGTSGTPAYYITFAFKIVRYAAIIILIVFSIMDFVNAVSSSDNDELQKAVRKTILRVVYCIIIFLLPELIDLLLGLLDQAQISNCININ